MQYTYPAVFYYDEEYGDYAVEFSDICIYAEGDTIEDAYKNAQEYLLAYLETCEKLKSHFKLIKSYYILIIIIKKVNEGYKNEKMF